MKALVCDAPGSLVYVTREKPLLKPGQAILRIKNIGICGTDLHAYEGVQPYFTYPRILGHELSGELVEFDDRLTGFASGDPVTFLPYFNCGHCIACRTLKPNCCVNLQVCGVHIDGGMTEYLSVPGASLVSGHGLSFQELALVEPLAIGAHGIRRAGVVEGEFVLVVGAGPIGLAAMEFARLAGARVIALDISVKRLEFCRSVLKVQHTINGAGPLVNEHIKEITHGDLPTVIIDATGSLQAIKTSFGYMAHGTRYVLIGLQNGDICFSHPEFHKREGTLMSSRNATRDDFNLVIQAMKNGHVNPLNFITHQVNFDDIALNFSKWLKPESGVIKAMARIE